MGKTKYAYLYQISDAHGFGPLDNVRTIGCYTDHKMAIDVLKQQLYHCWEEKDIERHSTYVYCTSVHNRNGRISRAGLRIMKVRANAEDPWNEEQEPIILYKELA